MKPRLTDGSNGRLAALGLLFAMPALYFVSANVLKYELNVLPDLRVLPTPPAVLLGGLVLSAVLNLWPVLHVGIGRTGDVSTLIITLHAHLLNLAGLGITVVVLGTLLLYAVVENIGHF